MWFDRLATNGGRVNASGSRLNRNGRRRSRTGDGPRVNKAKLGRNGRRQSTTAMAAGRAANQDRTADARRGNGG